MWNYLLADAYGLTANCNLVQSPTASFLSTSGKKRGKETPQGTNGSLTSVSLRSFACVPPAKNPSPVARVFGVSRILARLMCREITTFSAARIGHFIFPWQSPALHQRLTRSAAYPYGGRSASFYIFERCGSEKRSRGSTTLRPEVTLFRFAM